MQRNILLYAMDCDGHRSGVKPQDPLLLEIARLLHSGGLDTPEALRAIAEQEGARCVVAAGLALPAGEC